MNFILYIIKDVPQDFMLDLNPMFCTAIAVNIPYFMKYIASATSCFLYACYIVIDSDYYMRVCVCLCDLNGTKPGQI